MSLTFYGQTCDTIDGNLINCIDTAGLRQGYWELTKKKILVSGYGGLGGEDGCGYFDKTECYPRSKGTYKDGKKIDTWEYYSGEHLISLDRKITYYKDGAIKDDYLAERYTLNINSDTTVITGRFYLDIDSLNIDCQVGKCIVTLTDGQELTSFQFNDFDKLEFELLRIKIGAYNKEIKMKKNPH